MTQPDKPRFDLSQLGEADRQNLASTFLKAIQRFYENPANIDRFEEWQAQRQARHAAIESQSI